MDTNKREKQENMLNRLEWNETAGLCSERRYTIKTADTVETVHCASTAIMLLDTVYANIDVEIYVN